jgi:hypothetical protein
MRRSMVEVVWGCVQVDDWLDFIGGVVGTAAAAATRAGASGDCTHLLCTQQGIAPAAGAADTGVVDGEVDAAEATMDGTSSAWEAGPKPMDE